MSSDAPLDDLARLVEATGPFVTIAMPTPSELDDAQHRFEIRWKNARRDLESSRWTSDDVAELDALVASLPHEGGAALVLVRAADGTTFAEFLDEPVRETVVAESPLPRLAPVIEARQRAIAHLVVEADRAGADIHAFDGGRVLGTEQVDGDTEHIHRGHPGGWSQRRFQQRAENTWERNADDVAAQIVEMVEQFGAEMVFVAGDVRARHLVVDALPERVRNRTALIEAGSPEGVADEVVRLLADHSARGIRDLVERLKERHGTGTASTDVADVSACLVEGRVEHLLVHDDGTDHAVTAEPVGRAPAGARVVDAAIAAALHSGAEVTVVPRVAALNGPIAALYRW
jgi:hypothetical protein